ncbi:hypothetical protein [Vibrio vulnificus]|uniref:hypothetical protein n=1 Tax=Vibrio vulnificus TaxID=672 RepID=UPI00324258F9
MSLWVLIPLSFVHITVGGAIGFGLVFAACAERGVTMSQFSNDVCGFMVRLHNIVAFKCFLGYLFLSDR